MSLLHAFSVLNNFSSMKLGMSMKILENYNTQFLSTQRKQ